MGWWEGVEVRIFLAGYGTDWRWVSRDEHL